MDQPGRAHTEKVANIVRWSVGAPPTRLHGHEAETEALRLAQRELTDLREALKQAWGEIAELRRLADQDCLSGLCNRRRLMAELELRIARASVEKQAAALLFIDMDDLKSINDRHGHPAGDLAICHIAGLISDYAATCLAARLGGDEFALVIKADDEGCAIAQAGKLKAHIAASRLEAGGGALTLSVSIGVAMIGPGVTAEELMAEADSAMYAAKRKGQAAGRSAR